MNSEHCITALFYWWIGTEFAWSHSDLIKKMDGGIYNHSHDASLKSWMAITVHLSVSETLLISLKPVCNPQALMIRGCSDSEPAEVTVTKWGETGFKGKRLTGNQRIYVDASKTLREELHFKRSSGRFSYQSQPGGGEFWKLCLSGGRNDKRRREMCFTQWLAESVQAKAAWQKLYGAKLSIRIMNIMIRAMILTLHACACLSMGSHK